MFLRHSLSIFHYIRISFEDLGFLPMPNRKCCVVVAWDPGPRMSLSDPDPLSVAGEIGLIMCGTRVDTTRWRIRGTRAWGPCYHGIPTYDVTVRRERPPTYTIQHWRWMRLRIREYLLTPILNSVRRSPSHAVIAVSGSQIAVVESTMSGTPRGFWRARSCPRSVGRNTIPGRPAPRRRPSPVDRAVPR
jgi:hypothetical protein